MEREEDGAAVAVPEDPAAGGRADRAGAADRELRTGPEPVVQLRGAIAPDLAAYARAKVAGVLGHTGHAVLHVRVRVRRHADPARAMPVTARATVDLDGVPVHVSVAARKPRAAVDALADRLDRRLARVVRRRVRGRALPGAQPSGDPS